MKNQISQLKDDIGSDNNYQVIGIDVGRSTTLGYTEYQGKVYKYDFLSIISDARQLSNLNNYKDPINITTEDGQYFVGELALKEGYQVVRNSSDSKTSLTVRVLIQAMLFKLAKTENVKIMINVPNNQFKKSVLLQVVSTYKDKTYVIKDNIYGKSKVVKILECDINREGDACAFDVMGNDLNDKDSAFITVGYRTSEISFFNKNMMFNDKYSRTISYGVDTMLLSVKNELKNRDIVVETFEIDNNHVDYNDLKSKAFELANEIFTQNIEGVLPQRDSEINLYIAGGGSLHLNNLDDRFIKVEDPIYSVARGLYHIGSLMFA